MRFLRLKHYFAHLDPVFLIALALAIGFSCNGITWGRAEDWNRDQMALRELRGVLPLDYQKPPLHTYLNHLLVLAPIGGIEDTCAFLGRKNFPSNELRLLGSRVLVLLLFLGTIYCAYLLSRDAFGLSVARMIALVFASSAGFVEYNHFLSCDSPLLFFLLLTLLLAYQSAVSGKLSLYLLAGLFTGLSAAMKYNGLFIGVTLIVAHLWAKDYRNWGRLLFDRRLLLCLAMVLIGFFIGNPGALIDSRKFVADFTYNSKVTPHYDGTMAGHSYLDFLARVPAIVGWPGAILLAICAMLSLVIVLTKRERSEASALCFSLAGVAFALYFLVIGSFPRQETRFVLPAVPFLIFMAGPFLAAARARGKWPFGILLALLLYNCTCSYLVGQRFRRDPRVKAQAWVAKHTHPGLTIESSAEAPRWTKLAAIGGVEIAAGTPLELAPHESLIDYRMPYAYGRLQLFRKLFPHDAWLQQHIADYEIEADESLFTAAALGKRHPQFVAIYSTDYQVPSTAVRSYYTDLIAGLFPYRIVFDAATEAPLWWTYPKKIDFLSGRLTILKRQAHS